MSPITPITTTGSLLLAFFDGIGESVTPTANFVPPTSFPLSRLRNSTLTQRTRTPDLTLDRYLQWDWGSPIEFNVFMLAGANASFANTVRRIRHADDSGFTVNVAESGATLTSAFDQSSLGRGAITYSAPWGKSLIYVHSTSLTKRYTRWHQSDPGNVDGFQSWAVARIGLGSQYPFTAWSKEPVIVGTSGSEKSMRKHSFTLYPLTRQQAYDVESIAMSCGPIRRVLCLPETLNTSTWWSDAIWGVFDGVWSRETIPSTSYDQKMFKVEISIKEVDR